jgi:hypothetical protein
LSALDLFFQSSKAALWAAGICCRSSCSSSCTCCDTAYAYPQWNEVLQWRWLMWRVTVINTLVAAFLQGHLLSVKGHMLASLDAAVASEHDAGASQLAAKQVSTTHGTASSSGNQTISAMAQGLSCKKRGCLRNNCCGCCCCCCCVF